MSEQATLDLTALAEAAERAGRYGAALDLLAAESVRGRRGPCRELVREVLICAGYLAPDEDLT